MHQPAVVVHGAAVPQRQPSAKAAIAKALLGRTLRWLDRHDRQRGESPPLGIILCAGKKRETVEYLDLGIRGIHVAGYLTDLPPREVLEERLRRAIEVARSRLAVDASLDADSPAPRLPAHSRRTRGGEKTR